MKKTIFCLFIFISSLVYSQEFIDTAKLWNTVIHRLPSFTIITESIKFKEDTTIDNIDYKKVFRSTDELQAIWQPYGYIRECNYRKVFYRTDSTSEFLLYDFNLELNDIVEVYGISGYGDVYNLSPMTFKLSKIDSVFFGDKYREQFHLNPVFPGDTLQEASEFWIEGIGSKSGILHWDALLVGGDSFELLCYSKKDSLIYQNPSYTSCYLYWTGFNKNEYDIIINIYPNPAIDKLTVKIDNYDFNKDYILEIYDKLGRNIFNKKINNTYYKLDRNKFKSGLYIFRIVCNGETIKTEKILIK